MLITPKIQVALELLNLQIYLLNKNNYMLYSLIEVVRTNFPPSRS